MLFHEHWRNFVRPGREGWIKVTPENSDDIWCLYNVIAAGDEVEAFTIRRVILENSSGVNVDSTKVKVLLAVKAEKIDVDIKGASLRVNGKNVKENEHVKLGIYHTIDLEPGRAVKISKEAWDLISLEYLEAAASSVGKAEIGAIQIQDGTGLGFVCSVTPKEVKILQRIEVAMPKKKLGSTSTAEKAQEKFKAQLIEAALQHLKFASLKAIVIASHGQAKDDFYKAFIDHLQKSEMKEILGHKNKFMRVSLTGGAGGHLNPHSLIEVLNEPRIADLLADTKSAQETKLLDQLQKILNNPNEDEMGVRATFGLKHVQRAADEYAIKELLLADGLFRSANVEERRQYGKLISEVKQNGGKVTIFTPHTKVDEDLVKLSGVAAILSYPLEFNN